MCVCVCVSDRDNTWQWLCDCVSPSEYVCCVSCISRKAPIPAGFFPSHSSCVWWLLSTLCICILKYVYASKQTAGMFVFVLCPMLFTQICIHDAVCWLVSVCEGVCGQKVQHCVMHLLCVCVNKCMAAGRKAKSDSYYYICFFWHTWDCRDPPASHRRHKLLSCNFSVLKMRILHLVNLSLCRTAVQLLKTNTQSQSTCASSRITVGKEALCWTFVVNTDCI